MRTTILAFALTLALGCRDDGGKGVSTSQTEGGHKVTPECDGPVYFRVRNASDLDFDSATIAGMDFGPVRSEAQTDYRQAGVCPNSLEHAVVTIGSRNFTVLAGCAIGSSPMKSGYYTHDLEPLSSGQLKHEISRDHR